MPRVLQLVESRVSALTQWHFLVLRDGENTAVGECSDSGRIDRLVEQLDLVVPLVEGRDLEVDREDMVAELLELVATSDAAFVTATLVGGLEQLLTDHAAQAAGQPVWKWLGGSAPLSVPVYANINRMSGGRAPDDVAAMAQQAVAGGFSSIKLAPFDVAEAGEDLLETGLARLRAVRDAVGPDVALKVDCHERLTIAEVHAGLPALESLGIAWLEDAVSLSDVVGLRDLRSATGLPLAGGETMFAASEAQEAIDEELLDVLMPDVKHAGGISRVLDIARASPGVAISPHNPSGPVATAASAHLFAACPNATELEYQFGEVSWRSDLVGGRERVTDGRLKLGNRPGLGVALPASHPSFHILWSATV